MSVSDLAETDPADLRAALVRMGLTGSHENPRFTPLTGGVSSDIWKVDSARGAFAVKRARAQLKVAQVWRAPIGRNAYEVKWFREAGAVAPGCVPEILGEDGALGLFAMTYLEPADHPVWKEELRCERVDRAFAAEVGRRLASFHAATAGDARIAAEFATDETFHAIRLEPYLEATARVHAEIAQPLMDLSRDTLAEKRALVHGDISPKNILVGPHSPVFLDAECAWYGDPAFDVAFCLKHLLLKCLWTPAASAAFLSAYDGFVASYLANVSWESRDGVEARVARLLPGLFLARADGKSPVEYIDEEGKRRVRHVAIPLVASPPSRLSIVREAWAAEIGASTR